MNISIRDSIINQNYLLNSDFRWWQRGFSFTNNNYTADRWASTNVGTTKTVTQILFPINMANISDNPIYGVKIEVSSVTGPGNYCMLYQKIEDVRTLAGQTVTVSFDCKADSEKYIGVELYQFYGTGTDTSDIQIPGKKIKVSNVWKRYSVSFTLKELSLSPPLNANHFLQLGFFFDTGTNWDYRSGGIGHQSGIFELTHIKLEKGEINTPYITPPLSDINKLFRYYEYLNSTNPGIQVIPAGNSYYTFVPFKVVKRVIPTCTINENIGNPLKIEGITTYGIHLRRTDGGYFHSGWYTANAEL